MKHAGTRTLYAYWNTLRGARRAPGRRDLDPMQIARVLPDVLLLDLDRQGALTIRLAGTRLCEFFATELRGLKFADLWDTRSADEIAMLSSAVFDEAACAVIGAEGHARGGRRCAFEGLLMPLAGAEREERHVIAGLNCRQLPPWIGAEPLSALSLTGHRLTWPSGRILPLPEATEDTTPAIRIELVSPRPRREERVLAHAGARRVGRFMVYEGGQAQFPSQV